MHYILELIDVIRLQGLLDYAQMKLEDDLNNPGDFDPDDYKKIQDLAREADEMKNLLRGMLLARKDQ